MRKMELKSVRNTWVTLRRKLGMDRHDTLIVALQDYVDLSKCFIVVGIFLDD